MKKIDSHSSRSSVSISRSNTAEQSTTSSSWKTHLASFILRSATQDLRQLALKETKVPKIQVTKHQLNLTNRKITGIIKDNQFHNATLSPGEELQERIKDVVRVRILSNATIILNQQLKQIEPVATQILAIDQLTRSSGEESNLKQEMAQVAKLLKLQIDTQNILLQDLRSDRTHLTPSKRLVQLMMDKKSGRENIRQQDTRWRLRSQIQNMSQQLFKRSASALAEVFQS